MRFDLTSDHYHNFFLFACGFGILIVKYVSQCDSLHEKVRGSKGNIQRTVRRSRINRSSQSLIFSSATEIDSPGAKVSINAATTISFCSSVNSSPDSTAFFISSTTFSSSLIAANSSAILSSSASTSASASAFSSASTWRERQRPRTAPAPRSSRQHRRKPEQNQLLPLQERVSLELARGALLWHGKQPHEGAQELAQAMVDAFGLDPLFYSASSLDFLVSEGLTSASLALADAVRGHERDSLQQKTIKDVEKGDNNGD
jgi:hypothetical protein